MIHPTRHRAWRPGGALFGVLLLMAIYWSAVTWNCALVFPPLSNGASLVVLADGDSHSRLQRAAVVAESPGTIIRHHTFENHPFGTIPHTTAPMDYLIAALGVFVRPLDTAAAWVSPLLGLLTILFLWFWARQLDLRPRWPMLLLAAISPAIIHAFALGRPDHQSLLLALTTIALASNLAMTRTAHAAWAWTSAVAWGLALWVSWFEPLVLLMTQEVVRSIVWRKNGWPKIWRHAALLIPVIALTMWALEGFRLSWPDAEVRELFPRWAASIGELHSPGIGLIFGWTGWLLAVAPLLLVWDWRKNRDRTAVQALLLLAVIGALAAWQARWSPWLAMIFCLSLPWALRPLARSWLVWVVFIISLWPVGRAWETRTQPAPAEQARRREQLAEALMIEDVARFLAAQPPGGVLAPWWISPALARQSGHPCVAGSSHQSLPGIADTARFYLATNDTAAQEILCRRAVRYVVTDASERIIPTSAQILGITPPLDPMIGRLARGRNVPAYLQPVFANAFQRVYKVRDE
jgi:hypothetical protein